MALHGPGTMIWCWFLFPSTIVRVQRWSDTALHIGIGVSYWVQYTFINVCCWPMESYELGNHLNYWMMVPGDDAFNSEALNPIS